MKSARSAWWDAKIVGRLTLDELGYSQNTAMEAVARAARDLNEGAGRGAKMPDRERPTSWHFVHKSSTI